MSLKKNLTEQEIRTRYILPAIQKAGWQPHQIGEEKTSEMLMQSVLKEAFGEEITK